MALCHDVTDDLKEPVPFVPGTKRYLTYEAMVHSMDKQVGKLISAIDDLGICENTLIVFTTDNGTPGSYIATARDGRYIRVAFFSLINGMRIRGGKGTLLRTGTNVPLIASWPGRIKKRQVVDQLVDFSDILPTFTELGRAKLPKNVALDGHSFVAPLRGAKGKGRQWAFAERGKKHFVCTQRYKLYNDGRFIDLQNDVMEKRPLTKWSEEATAVRKKLARALQELAAMSIR